MTARITIGNTTTSSAQTSVKTNRPEPPPKSANASDIPKDTAGQDRPVSLFTLDDQEPDRVDTYVNTQVGMAIVDAHDMMEVVER